MKIREKLSFAHKPAETDSAFNSDWNYNTS